MLHNSVEACRVNWNGTDERPRAGQAMSKALRAVGISINPFNGVMVSIVTHPHDSYHLNVPSSRVDEVVAELWKDNRVIEVRVDGVSREKPAQKTVEEVEAEFAAFKKKVAVVAMQKAKKHDWCSVVQDALEEMGLEVPKSKARVVLEFDVDGDDLSKEEIKSLVYDLNRDDLYEAIQSFELTQE